jgi:hypothetical protein
MAAVASQCPDECRKRDPVPPAPAEPPDQDDGQGGPEGRAGGDADEVRLCQRVPEEGLVDGPGDGQRHPYQACQHHPGEANLEEDSLPGRGPVRRSGHCSQVIPQNAEDGAWRDRDRSPCHPQRRHQQQQAAGQGQEEPASPAKQVEVTVTLKVTVTSALGLMAGRHQGGWPAR